jgi:hypothetical protein
MALNILSYFLVAGHQDHILAALIHTQKSLPYHQEMVTNYMREARLRYGILLQISYYSNNQLITPFFAYSPCMVMKCLYYDWFPKKE